MQLTVGKAVAVQVAASARYYLVLDAENKLWKSERDAGEFSKFNFVPVNLK
jgi:hypothetical protein